MLFLQIWSCESCFSFLHLNCVRRWANDSIAQQRMHQENGENGGYYTNQGEYVPKKEKVIKWCCPKCRFDYAPSEVNSSQITPIHLINWNGVCLCDLNRYPKNTIASAKKNSIRQIIRGLCRIHAVKFAGNHWSLHAAIVALYSVIRDHVRRALASYKRHATVVNRTRKQFDAHKIHGNAVWR